MVDRITHIGVVVKDLESAVRLWSEAYGLEVFRRLEIVEEGIRNAVLSPSGGPDEMAVELMEPMDKTDMKNAVARRLAKAGEGIYHLAFQVGDVEESGRGLAELGLEVITRPPVVEGDSQRCLVHPKSSNGVLVELVDAATVNRITE